MIKRTVAFIAISLLLGCEPTQAVNANSADADNSEYCTVVQHLEGWNSPFGSVYSCKFPNGDRCYIAAMGDGSMECEFNK